MKKITFLMMSLCGVFAFSQQKTTGLVNLSANQFATLALNNATTTATLTLTGPNDRWFALQFGSFADGDGMMAGQDLVYWNNTTLVDARHNGVGVTPTNDSVNNWVLVSNTNNTPSAGLRTIVFTRAFNTGDVNDYVFNFADSSIDFAWAKSNSASYSLAYHQGQNRGYAIDTPFTLLGVEDFSLKASSLFPNPTSGDFSVKTKTYLTQVNVYTQTGAFVKTIKVEDDSENVELNISGLQTGVYLIELKNDTDKTWKKIIVN